MFDWQTAAVILIVLAALAYVARRALARLRSFRLSRRTGAPACSTGCGACGETEPQTPPARPFVQITSSKNLPRRSARRP